MAKCFDNLSNKISDEILPGFKNIAVESSAVLKSLLINTLENHATSMINYAPQSTQNVNMDILNSTIRNIESSVNNLRYDHGALSTRLDSLYTTTNDAISSTQQSIFSEIKELKELIKELKTEVGKKHTDISGAMEDTTNLNLNHSNSMILNKCIEQSVPAPTSTSSNALSCKMSTANADSEVSPIPETDTIIHKFGTTWTSIEWKNRLNRLQIMNKSSQPNHLDSLRTTLDEVSHYHIKGSPPFADSQWICNLFKKKYAIDISKCEVISFNKKSKCRTFKIAIFSKYDWLFSRYNGEVLITNSLTMQRRKNKQPKAADSSKVTNYTKGKSYDHKPKTNNKDINTDIIPNTNSTLKKAPNLSSRNKSLAPSIHVKPAQPSPPGLHLTIQNTPLSPPPSSISHTSVDAVTPSSSPVIDLSKSKAYSNFYQRPALFSAKNDYQNDRSVNSQFSIIDPLLPPVVKLSKISADSNENRYLLGRLRDRRIFNDIRLYLAYLHKQPGTVCIDGMTKTSLHASIQQEGFPTDIGVLKSLYIRFHEHLGLSANEVEKDLSTFASHISSKRISYLQRSRDDYNKFFRSK